MVRVEKAKMPGHPQAAIRQAQDLSGPIINRFLQIDLRDRINNALLFRVKRLPKEPAVIVLKQ